MWHFFNEIFYTTWEYILYVAYPLGLPLVLLDHVGRFYHLLPRHISEATYLAYAIIINLGIVFSEWLIYTVIAWLRSQRRLKTQPLAFSFFAKLYLLQTIPVALVIYVAVQGDYFIWLLYFWLLGAAVPVFLIGKGVLLLIDKILKLSASSSNWLILGIVIFTIYPLVAASIAAIELFASPLPNRGSHNFHVINAAIKNTCFIDPKRENCPTTLEEISYIEPQKFKVIVDANQVRYTYYPESNLYTLVIRYHPVRAVVFDWRLNEEFGIDFHEYTVKVLGKDELLDPPHWDGPWEFPEWRY